MAPPPCNVLNAIGNTPVVKLNRIVPDGSADVYVKLEYFNPTGSYKDRMAKSMIECAEQRGALKPGMTVVEATGGSTGSSLAFVCAVKGYTMHVVCSDAFSHEKRRTITALGARLDLVPSVGGKITPELIPAMVARAVEGAEKQGWYYTNQFINKDALVGYQDIGHELVAQFPPGGIDAVCGAIGTAGMMMGVGKVFRDKMPSAKVVLLEPSSAPYLTQGHGGAHGVEGTAVEKRPAHLDDALYDEAWAVDEDEARAMCRRLASEEGLIVGTSTGLNVVAALRLASTLGKGKTVVTVAVDTGFKYMNGPLFE